MLVVLEPNDTVVETVTSISVIAVAPLVLYSACHRSRELTVTIAPSPGCAIREGSFPITVLEPLLSQRPSRAFLRRLLAVLVEALGNSRLALRPRLDHLIYLLLIELLLQSRQRYLRLMRAPLALLLLFSLRSPQGLLHPSQLGCVLLWEGHIIEVALGVAAELPRFPHVLTLHLLQPPIPSFNLLNHLPASFVDCLLSASSFNLLGGLWLSALVTTPPQASFAPPLLWQPAPVLSTTMVLAVVAASTTCHPSLSVLREGARQLPLHPPASFVLASSTVVSRLGNAIVVSSGRAVGVSWAAGWIKGAEMGRVVDEGGGTSVWHKPWWTVIDWARLGGEVGRWDARMQVCWLLERCTVVQRAIEGVGGVWQRRQRWGLQLRAVQLLGKGTLERHSFKRVLRHLGLAIMSRRDV